MEENKSIDDILKNIDFENYDETEENDLFYNNFNFNF